MKGNFVVILALLYAPVGISQDLSDSVHESISDSIEITANFIDDFFVNERRNEEGTRSQVVISYQGILDTEYAVDNQYRLSARLHLPNTENKLRFLIQNAVDFNAEEDETPLQTAVNPAQEQDQYLAALQYVLAESKQWQVSTRGGVKIGIPLDPFARLRIRRTTNFTYVDLRMTQQFYWSEVDRFEESSVVELDRLLNEIFFTRLRFDFSWGEQDRLWIFINDLALYQKLKQSLVIRYDLGYLSELNKKFEVQRLFFNITYRRNILKKWMFYEVVPEVYWTKDDWKETRFRFLFRLDFVFGKAFN